MPHGNSSILPGSELFLCVTVVGTQNPREANDYKRLLNGVKARVSSGHAARSAVGAPWPLRRC